MKKQLKIKENETQLSLFEEHQQPAPLRELSVLEFARARLEYGPDMTPEEYRRWIKILIHSSLRKIE